MTQKRRNEIFKLISEIADDPPDASSDENSVPEKVEMLTVKECTEVVPGLSEHSVRKFISQGNVKFIRAGDGKRGKYLINKGRLIDLCSKVTE